MSRILDIEPFATQADVEAMERIPLLDRVPYRNVIDGIRRAAARRPEASAITWLRNGRAEDEPEHVNFRTFAHNMLRTANLLHELGVRPERAVSILMSNRPETYYALWGGSAAGVANPINPLLNPAQIVEIMAAAGSRVLVTGGPDMAYDVFEKAKAVRALYPALEEVVVVGETEKDIHYFSAIERHCGDKLNSGRELEPNDVSIYFHTGGTTGAPKLAQQTHWNQIATTWSCTYAFGLTERDSLLTGLPLFHANAAVSTGLTGLLIGANTLLCGELGYRNKAMMGDFWPIVTRFKPSVFIGVPTIYASLLDALPEKIDIRSLRFGICGAAPMPVPLFREFEERTGVRILECYGMTEGGALSTCNPRDGERQIGSIGMRLPYQYVRPVILDAAGDYVRDCAEDEIGALLLNGPNLFPGYRQEKFNAPENWPLPGWFNSGDLGRKRDGFFWMAGRSKDLIIRSGHNIDPAVIEEALQRHPSVGLAAAVGKPHPYAGEVPIAYVQLAAHASASAAELRTFARENIIEGPAAPAEIIILDAIPVTAVGKTFKPALRLDATRRALVEALGKLDVTVETLMDDRRGLVAVITCADDVSENDVHDCLKRFAVSYDIVR